MIWAVFVTLLTLWAGAITFGHPFGDYIHLLLITAAVVVLYAVIVKPDNKQPN